MSGWIALLLLMATTLLLLWALGVRGGYLQLTAAALLFGAAGYALHGRPDLDSSPRGRSIEAAPVPLTQLRHAFFGQFSGGEHWILISESYARRGDTEKAAGVMQSAVRARPNNIALWIGLGNALVDHAGTVTPASQLAFRRADSLAPGHPAPQFFFGLALARSGDSASAVMLWQDLLAKAPADAGWRPLVEDAIAVLEAPSRQADR